MEKWLLVVADQKSIFIETQKAWLRKNMFLTVVPSMKDAARRLLDKDYLAVAAFRDDPSPAIPFFTEIRRIKPGIPVIFMPSECGKTPDGITRQLEAAVEAAEPDSPAQPEAPEAPGASPEPRPLVYRDLSVHPQFRVVLFHGQEVQLSRCQFDALTALMENQGRILTFEQLYDRVYGEFTEAGNTYSATRYYIAEIRRRLNEIAAFDYIENVRGVGYRMRYRPK